ncbi:glycosyltransferase family 2 protein [Christiangramia portivictoriae]|uniref:glycosyltransferase family 2 protein n=1 Tax=Christiangramia portivictoriae TaxID=326069 RepID=UPI0003F70DAA|nr:glycosyltransferase [Christiangramia portivictoriae]
MLSIIYPYRNRDVERLRRSFESLQRQTNRNFQVFFVDYGSRIELAGQVEDLCKNYSFNYRYCYTEKQPWNKSKAINNVVQDLESEFCFVADVDMIFHPEFIEEAGHLQKKDHTVYFQVGFLGSNESFDNKEFRHFKNYRKSTPEATGLTMFPVSILKELHGFDEFYHFWGSEDSDMHVRIRNAGYKVDFYDHKVLMLHQWHSSYRSKVSDKLTPEFQLKDIVRLNNQHYNHARESQVKKVNLENWGNCLKKGEFQTLENADFSLLSNRKEVVDHLLYCILPQINNEIVKYRISDSQPKSLKITAKQIVGKNISKHYSLKQVNDLILLHLITFYRNKPYSYKVGEDLRYIEFSIDFRKNKC